MDKTEQKQSNLIPKRIFQTWYTKDLDPIFSAWVKRTIDMNPGYTYYLFDDDDMEEFVKAEYPGEIAECFLRLNIPTARADFWRYLVLYRYGGVYIDMDSPIHRPLDELIRPDDEAILSRETNPVNYVQWALMFIAGHPILKQVIDLVVDNIKTNRYPNDIGDMTGPGPFRRAIAKECAEKGYAHHVSNITTATDETYGKRGESFRVYGLDYSPYLSWCEGYIKDHMRRFRAPWGEEQARKPLLKW